MLRRNFDAPPLTRLLQASVLIAFAAGMMALAMHAESGTSRIAIDGDAARINVDVAH